MATLTLGTNATTSLVAVNFSYALSAADIASIAQLIRDDVNVTHPVIPTSFVRDGLLLMPGGRGVLKVFPGDYVAVDVASGQPIVLTARAIAAGPWTHS